MTINELFSKDIERNIKGVIKVDQKEEDIIYLEMDEYVVTNEIKKYLAKFFNNYEKSIDEPTDEMGVWISGFFGSGKSHLLKILSYILSNKTIKDKKAIEFFKDKIDDEMLYSSMIRSASINADTILFNIDAEGQADGKSDKEAIVKVFRKMFYKNIGLHGDNITITEFEKFLYQENKYEEFKACYKEEMSTDWEESRNKFAFQKNKIKNIMAKVLNMSEEDKEVFDFKDLENEITIKNFAKEVNDYINEKAKNNKDYKLIFLIDEVGQYIGDNSSLMLNLQTVVEELGNFCKGKVWVMVTSQEDLDSITKNIKGNDFSKIQGRFKTKLNLSSASVGEVIRKRILDKTETATKQLEVIYQEKETELKNLITFSEDSSSDFSKYKNSKDFVNLYPFINYQIPLLQRMFEEIRKHASSGQHLSEGERSMLSAIQETLIKFKNYKNEILIPFYMFYESIESFLVSTVRRVIDIASESKTFEEFDIKILKTLFMIRYIKEMPSNIENLTTLMVEKFNQDKVILKEEIDKSLKKLIKENLVNNNGDTYIFLTDDEQEINKEIKNIFVDDEEINKQIHEYIFGDITLLKTTYKYNRKYDFPFSKEINENKYNQNADIVIKIISDETIIKNNFIMDSSGQSNYLYIDLTENNIFSDEIINFRKIEKYVNQRGFSNRTDKENEIIENKKHELSSRKKRAKEQLEVALLNADFYLQGNKLSVNGTTAKEKLENAIKIFIESVYTNLNEIGENYTNEKELQSILDEKYLQTFEYEKNRLAIESVKTLIGMNGKFEKITVKQIIDKFSKIPYGWTDYDTISCLLKLYKNQAINFKYNSEDLTDNKIGFINKIFKERERIIVEKKEKTDEKVLKEVKRSYHELFLEDLGNITEDELSEKLKIRIKNEQQIILEKLNLYEKEKKYPGKDLIIEKSELLDLIRLNSDNTTLFKSFLKVSEDLIDWKEKAKNLEDFFSDNSPQKNIFDEALKKLSHFENNNLDLKNTELPDLLEKLIEITENKNPYSLIKNIPEIIEKIDEKYEALKQLTKNEVLKTFNNEQKKLIDYIEQPLVSSELKEEIRNYLNNSQNELENFDKIESIKSKNYEIISKINDYHKKVDNQIAELNNPYEENYKQGTFNVQDPIKEKIIPNTNKQFQPHAKSEFINIKINTLINDTANIKNSNDIENFIKEIKEKITEYLDNADEIRIIK